MSGYLPVFIYLALIVAFALVSLGAAFVLRPARPYFSKLENYECGAEPIGEAWVQFPVGFYLVALIFVVFDALAIFLFPWAVAFRERSAIAPPMAGEMAAPSGQSKAAPKRLWTTLATQPMVKMSAGCGSSICASCCAARCV